MTPLPEKALEEATQLCCGVFWIITDNYDLSESTILVFDIPCNPDGTLENGHLSVELNSKKGNTYNHKKLWDTEVRNKSQHKPYNKKDFDYYPRGRVEISRNKATIFLSPHINTETVIKTIKQEFGLLSYNISTVNVVADGSAHYQCWMDR